MPHPIRHFITITRHRHRVIAHCFRAGIGWQGLFHDLSKYTPTEFFAGAKYYLGTRSPNEGEREKNGYSLAWMHHKGRNRHHFEYWVDINPVSKRYEPVKMPLRFVIEMFCDRVAASKIYQGKNYKDTHPIEYFMRGKDRRSIHPATSDLLEEWLRMLSEKGEKETFRYIKSYKKAHKAY
ncbi:MAG: catalase [Ruminococcaceae bacterium]|nr:catalase [Oscillospiraceae bacterium]